MATLNFSSGKKPLSTFSAAGLTDIVLLLLIFFLLTSSFVVQFGIQVNVPNANASSVVEGQYLTVTITDDGQFFVGQDKVSREQLLATIRAQKGNREILILRADEKATVGQFAEVANIARALNMRILIATEQEL